jgi:uridine kinase
MESLSITAEQTHIIGLAGESCSGKSAIARGLVDKLRAHNPVLISSDSYYRDLSHIQLSERHNNNFDVPDAIEWELLLEDLRSLKKGAVIYRPEYDFVLHIRSESPVRISPSRFIVLEGLFVLYWDRVREMLNTKVFVDIDREIAMKRRVQRDLLNRGRSRASIEEQIEATVFPMADMYILPSKAHAEVVIDGSDDVDSTVNKILRLINI